MIKADKRKFGVCIVAQDQHYYKHLDAKKVVDRNTQPSGEEKAMKEAQRLANKLGKKVTVLLSKYNVYPDKTVLHTEEE